MTHPDNFYIRIVSIITGFFKFLL